MIIYLNTDNIFEIFYNDKYGKINGYLILREVKEIVVRTKLLNELYFIDDSRVYLIYIIH